MPQVAFGMCVLLNNTKIIIFGSRLMKILGLLFLALSLRRINTTRRTRRGERERDLGAVVRIAVVAEIGTGLWSVVRVGRWTAGGGRRSRRWEGLAASGHCCGKSSSFSASVLSG